LIEPRLDIPSLGSVDAGAGGARFVREPERVGARWRVAVRAATHEQDRPDGQDTRYESDLDVETLAVSGLATTEVRVRVLRNAYVYSGVEKPNPIAGKSYVVGISEPFVRDGTGGAAAPSEAERLLDIFPDLGTRTRLDEALPDGTLAIGERRDEVARAVLRIIHPRAWQDDAASATLARVENGDAVFDVELSAHDTGGSAQNFDVRGVVRVRLRGTKLVAITLEGTYANVAGGKSEGTFTYERRISSVGEKP
jgi:hypothetical protein